VNDIAQKPSEELQRAFNVATKQLTLSEIVEGMLAIFARIDEAEGEVTDEVAVELDMLAASTEQKVEAYAALYYLLREEADACDRFVQRYTERAKRKRNHAEALRTRLFDAMQITGTKQIKAPTATATIQKSAPALELLVPETEVPAEYVELRRHIRKDAITAALKNGVALEFARMKSGSHLRFR